MSSNFQTPAAAFPETLQRQTKNLVLFPNNIQSGIKPGFQWPKTEIAAFRCIGNFINGYCITDACLYHNCGILYKIECGDNIQFFKIFTKPVCKFIPGAFLRNRLPGTD